MILYSMGIHKETQRGQHRGHKPRQGAEMLLGRSKKAWAPTSSTPPAQPHNHMGFAQSLLACFQKHLL